MVRHLPASSYNRAYLTSCLRDATQIQPYGLTYDTLSTLSAIEADKSVSERTNIYDRRFQDDIDHRGASQNYRLAEEILDSCGLTESQGYS